MHNLITNNLLKYLVLNYDIIIQRNLLGIKEIKFKFIDYYLHNYWLIDLIYEF